MTWKNNGLFIIFIAILLSLTVTLDAAATGKENSKAKVLQEMTWVEVKDYLKTNDMVIIPIGSTEQHGPHLPLGTDYYEALGVAKDVSNRTGVVVAPVVMVGYSVYHSGFPGTLSLKPETLEQVLFETAEMLIKYGFRRFMFLNYHGGNNLFQDRVIHRINHSTKAVALAIGIGNSIQDPTEEKEEPGAIDWHAGKNETSIMLYLYPHLVQLEKARKPVLTFSPKVKALQALGKKDPKLLQAAQKYMFAPVETGKAGATHDISDNGIVSTYDPRQTATQKIGKAIVEKMAKTAADFINAWKKAD